MKKFKFLLLSVTVATLVTIGFQSESFAMGREMSSIHMPVATKILSNIQDDSLITWVIGIIATVFGGAWVWLKTRLGLIAKLAKEAVEVIDRINEALEDDSISKTEILRIQKELKDVQAAWKELVKKKE